MTSFRLASLLLTGLGFAVATALVHGADAPKTQKVDTAHLINITGNVLGSQWRAVELRHVSRVTITGNSIYDSADLSVFAVRSRR